MTDRTGIAGGDLADDDLERELATLHEKRHDIFLGGTVDQWHNHVARTSELETEFLRRFPDRVFDADGKGR